MQQQTRSVLDVTSPRFAVASLLGAAAAALPDPHAGPASRYLSRVAGAAFAGFWGAAMVRRTGPLLVPGEWAGAAGFALLTAAAAPLNEKLDARMVEALDRRRVPRPRVWLALLTAGGAALGVWAERRDAAAGADGDGLTGAEPSPVPLTPEQHELLRRMLAARSLPGSEMLLSQLHGARSTPFEPQPAPDLPLVVPPSSPRVVPHRQQWPVRARWAVGNGREVEASVWIDEGHLTHLSVLPLTEDADAAEQAALMDEAFDGWPDPDRTIMVVETGEGLRPA